MIFKILETIQVLELSVAANGPLGGNMETDLEVGFGIKVGEKANSDQKVIAVPLTFRASAGPKVADGAATLSAVCRLVGIWVVPQDFSMAEEDLRSIAAARAVPLLYVVARQHLGDLLGKVGARIDNWGWMPDGTPFMEGRSGSKALAGKKVRSKRVRAKK